MTDAKLGIFFCCERVAQQCHTRHVVNGCKMNGLLKTYGCSGSFARPPREAAPFLNRSRSINKVGSICECWGVSVNQSLLSM